MAKKKIRLTNESFNRVIRECVKRALNEASINGWVVNDDEEDVDRAYEFLVGKYGEEATNAWMVRELSIPEKARVLAGILNANDDKDFYDCEEEYHEEEY